ncbi:MAG: ComF family protein [Alphaproteobacteria bacterium]|nr:ComF family protein [Alphaproteobacteria bacterium]
MRLRLPGWLRAAGNTLLNTVFPPLCLACGEPTPETGQLCPTCFATVEFITPPQCQVCGAPFADEAGATLLCGACLLRRPLYARSRSCARYGDTVRGLVLAFKHGDRTELAPALAAMMMRAGAPLIAEADVIVPVPLHRWRLFRRRFNQAALLARAIARSGHKPLATQALARIRATSSQGRQRRRARFANVRGSFAVRRPQQVAGRAVLLIDDVLTTGATVAACTRVLRAAGAIRVDVLTFAQVVRPLVAPVRASAEPVKVDAH